MTADNLIQFAKRVGADIKELKARPKRPPMDFYIDQSSKPWCIVYDNGCILSLPSYGDNAIIYGVGSFQNTWLDDKLKGYPVAPIALQLSKKSLTIQKIQSTTQPSVSYWDFKTTVENPINDGLWYDWSKAMFASESYTLGNRQKHFIRVMYELGVFNDQEVESLGAVRLENQSSRYTESGKPE